MTLFRHDGLKLNYEVRGSLEIRPDQSAVFLSYCLGGNLSMWGREIDILAQRFPVVLWDPLGHGGTNSPADHREYGVNRSADDLGLLMDHLSIERAVVGGVSMGGGVAACFAGRFPERTSAVIIADSNTAAGLPVPDAVAETRKKTIDLCECGPDDVYVDMDAAARYFIEASPVYRLFEANSKENVRRINKMIASMNPIGFANTLRSMLQAETSTDDLLRITSPALVLAGDNDPAMKAIELTAHTISHCEFVKLPNAGHLSNIDQPELFASVILNFLDQHGVV